MIFSKDKMAKLVGKNFSFARINPKNFLSSKNHNPYLDLVACAFADCEALKELESSVKL